MSDITTNMSESQNKNQKTTPVTESFFELNNSSIYSPGGIFSTWLGMRDSNPRSRDQNPLPYRLANPQRIQPGSEYSNYLSKLLMGFAT